MARRSVIGKSKPYQRRNQRVEVPEIEVSFWGKNFRTLDWGLGGFRVSNFEGAMKKDEEFIVDGIWAGDEQGVLPVRIDYRAVWRKGPILAAAFIVLSSNDFEILEALMMRRKDFLKKSRMP